jgi:hypothetical protein
LRSFLIWSKTFLSCGLHRSDSTLDSNIRSKDKCSIVIFIFKLDEIRLRNAELYI